MWGNFVDPCYANCSTSNWGTKQYLCTANGKKDEAVRWQGLVAKGGSGGKGGWVPGGGVRVYIINREEDEVHALLVRTRQVDCGALLVVRAARQRHAELRCDPRLPLTRPASTQPLAPTLPAAAVLGGQRRASHPSQQQQRQAGYAGECTRTHSGNQSFKGAMAAQPCAADERPSTAWLHAWRRRRAKAPP